MKTILKVAIWITVFFVFRYVGQETRKVSQRNKFAHEVIMIADLIEFQQSGGGPFGYDNYFKWSYAKWRADPERTVFEKMMYWDIGFFYDASNPPKEYKYPFLL